MSNEADDEAIRKARSLLGERTIPSDWKASVHRNGELVSVHFDPPFVFLPANSHACYHVSVSLATKNVSAFTRSNPEESVSVLENSPCYVPPRRDRRKIKFVARAIRKEMKWDMLKDPPEDEMTIVERDDRYQVDVMTPNTHYFYSVNKATGKIENEGHGHFIPSPEGPFKPAVDDDVLDPDDCDLQMLDE